MVYRSRPALSSLSHVLAGEIIVDAFSCDTPFPNQKAHLNHAWSDRLRRGESAVLDPWLVNIHSVQADRLGAIVLTGLFGNKTLPTSRRWFFKYGSTPRASFQAAVLHQATDRK